jgi:hypothetical protein
LEGLQGCLGLIRSIYKTQTPLAVVAFYRAEGQSGSEARALVDPGLSSENACAALEAGLGVLLASFRIAEDPGAVPSPVILPPASLEVKTMPAIAIRCPPVRLPPPAPVLRSVEPGEVMPFAKHPLGALSEIRVTAPMSFPELTVWDETGQRPLVGTSDCRCPQSTGPRPASSNRWHDAAVS